MAAGSPAQITQGGWPPRAIGRAFPCVGGAALAATGGWLTPREAFAEARGIVSLIKDSAALSPIVAHKLRGNITVLEGSGGNVAVLTGPDGKVMIDAGIGVSRPQIPRRLPASAPIPSPI